MNQSSVTKIPVSDGVGRALEISLRGVEELLPQDEWIKKLARSEATGQPLRIKLGLDPTAPDIHIGHTVVLNKMRQLQDLGHQVIFLIGDFTSLIGDPSGRNSTRPPLTPEQIKFNAETYYRQASMVLDPARTEIRYNSEWSEPLGATGMIQLAARFTVARLEPQAAAAGVQLNIKGDDDLVINGEADQIDSAVTKLIENAIGYSKENGVVSVSASKDKDGDRAVIRVIDQGTGIAKKDQARIFERFYRGVEQSNRTADGVGLGLAIVKHVALTHHGDVTVWSAPGQGSTFSLTLPLAQ